MPRHATLAAVAAGTCFGLAHAAAAQVYAVQDFTTAASGADRAFVSTGFAGTSHTLDAAGLGVFTDGSLTVGSHTWGWHDAIPVETGSTLAFNPERAKGSTPFAGEAGPNRNTHSGTLAEVFGSRNLSYLMDGEDDAAFSLDLLFGDGLGLTADARDDTPELLLLERGANSVIGVRAILESGLRSDPLAVYFGTSGSRAGIAGSGGLAGYGLDTLEIGSVQKVAGLGIDLAAFGVAAGERVIGFNLFVEAPDARDWNGPDIVGFIGVAQPTLMVPTPPAVAATVPVLALAALRRRR